MQQLSSAITHCRFEASDSAADEIVLLRILKLMEGMIAGPGGQVLSDESVLSESSAHSGRSQLEDETAQDIKLASERRAANEAYFKRVDAGVKEVVEKLERVAEAMRDVEGESRSLWSNSDRSSAEVEQSRPAPPSVTISST